ncbi:helix-turn-helix domain-containing protein [Succinispira mobilis]|uniref:helix-turn-helix domain-containing protein n=1 Tax=Succinispira mobilis TaxID=78120 RepID=UPI0003806DB9|nr:helix-turn-helix domain-containing protein [Succinispira mobilis]
MELVTMYLEKEGERKAQRDAAELQRLQWISEVADFMKRRKEMGISRSDFAPEMGISKSTLYKLETGKKVRDRYHLLKLYEKCLRIFELIIENEELMAENRNLRNLSNINIEVGGRRWTIPASDINPVQRRSVI